MGLRDRSEWGLSIKRNHSFQSGFFSDQRSLSTGLNLPKNDFYLCFGGYSFFGLRIITKKTTRRDGQIHFRFSKNIFRFFYMNISDMS